MLAVSCAIINDNKFKKLTMRNEIEMIFKIVNIKEIKLFYYEYNYTWIKILVLNKRMIQENFCVLLPSDIPQISIYLGMSDSKFKKSGIL